MAVVWFAGLSGLAMLVRYGLPEFMRVRDHLGPPGLASDRVVNSTIMIVVCRRRILG